MKEKTNIPLISKANRFLIKKRKGKINRREPENRIKEDLKKPANESASPGKRIEISLEQAAKDIASDGSWIVVTTEDKFRIFTSSKTKD